MPLRPDEIASRTGWNALRAGFGPRADVWRTLL